ncbi:uncharacterized protein LTHEOB_12964 [Neofusicoccum parvum]|uniref:Uncharacterized protein LTHEOB_12964 n=1 Tax=Neofusicoccum parvum TaxID=310453 RepID=A0ACB5SLZ1_9PEZI|nr:uncharacterized protein LTHEOB_12964 [Neofusicoccum parvum]
MLPISSTLFIILLILLQTSAFYLPPNETQTRPSNCHTNSTIPSTPPTPSTLSSTTPPQTPAAAAPALPPTNLHCLAPTRHDLFFTHPDLPSLTFNIHTPWTLTYRTRLAAALRTHNYTTATPPPRACNWRQLDSVSHGLVRRGTLSRTVRDDDRYGGVGALAGSAAEVGRVMRATYPAVEVGLILGLTLWPAYGAVVFGVVACGAGWLGGRRRRGRGEEEEA